ncbi:hypothetical protein B1812_08870 [Methylocystis bryophila]|uniref:Uncharacterized protein n=1 Tax=Methylocystis bryophila TaxID=655015 RepID=A0A1W6MUD3_9HYPH|nr:hypothetical protein B1812_08870 [Methylocystis bryophila]
MSRRFLLDCDGREDQTAQIRTHCVRFPTFVRTMGSSSSGSRCAAFAASVSPKHSATVQGAENEAAIEASV